MHQFYVRLLPNPNSRSVAWCGSYLSRGSNMTFIHAKTSFCQVQSHHTRFVTGVGMIVPYTSLGCNKPAAAHGVLFLFGGHMAAILLSPSEPPPRCSTLNAPCPICANRGFSRFPSAVFATCVDTTIYTCSVIYGSINYQLYSQVFLTS